MFINGATYQILIKESHEIKRKLFEVGEKRNFLFVNDDIALKERERGLARGSKVLLTNILNKGL